MSASATCSAACPTKQRRAQRAQGRQRGGVLRVAPGDRDAAGEHDPGDAGQPGAADADEVHPAEPVGGEQLLGDGDPHRRPPAAAASSTRSASLSSASSGITPAAARDIAASRSGSREQGRHVLAHPVRGESGVGHEQRPAGVDDRAGVERLLAVADRQRHEHRRQPDAGHLGDGVAAGAADHERRRRRRRGPSGRRSAPRRTPGSRRGRSTSASPFGPTTCSTCTPAAARCVRGLRDRRVQAAGRPGSPR